MKIKMGFTVKEDVASEFRELAEKNSLNQSSFIEKYLQKYIEEHKEDKK